MYKVREITLPARQVGRGKRIICGKDAYDVLKDMGELGVETMQVLCLDTKSKVVDRQMVHIGSVDECSVSLACLFRPVVVSGCVRCLVAHNHPSGECMPSRADYKITKQMDKGCKLLDLSLVDHIIVGSDCFWSAVEGGAL